MPAVRSVGPAGSRFQSWELVLSESLVKLLFPARTMTSESTHLSFSVSKKPEVSTPKEMPTCRMPILAACVGQNVRPSAPEKIEGSHVLCESKRKTVCPPFVDTSILLMWFVALWLQSCAV